MRPTTSIWWRFESIGKPQHNVIGSGQVQDAIRALMRWVLETPMGHKIKVVLARSESELYDKRESGGVDSDMEMDFERLIANALDQPNSDSEE